jgi:D-erythro-7,8-dihydroneopterin triphosphate epimerase
MTPGRAAGDAHGGLSRGTLCVVVSRNGLRHRGRAPAAQALQKGGTVHSNTPSRATLRIANLSLRTIIGAHKWERTKLQDVVINLSLEVDPRASARSDRLGDTVDYKQLKQRIVVMVEKSRYRLLEALTAKILSSVMSDPGILAATVRVDKPRALSFADSVSVEMHAERQQ